MKQSQYNHYIPLEDGNYVLYNTMSGAILIIDTDVKNKMDHLQEGAELPLDLLNTFKQNGVVAESDENELLKFRDKYNTMHYHPENLLFTLTPTSSCNLACGYCWQRADESLVKKNDQTANMSESTLNGVLLFMKQMTEGLNTTQLSTFFYGGEPLMAKNLVFRILEDLAQWSEERTIDFLTSFYTNATLIDQQFIEKLHEYTINMIRTTLDGPKEIHDQYRHYRNKKGTYEEIVSAIGLLLDAGINVTVQININRHHEHVPELLDDLSERGLQKITILPRPLYDPMVMLQEAQKVYGLLPEEYPAQESTFSIPFKDIPQTKLRIYRWAFERGFSLVPPNMGSLPCTGAAYHFYVIDPYGDMYKCVASMLIKSMCVGHIHEDGYFERFPFFYEWANSNPTYVEKCQSCSLLPSCQGGCLHGRKLVQIPYLCEVSSFNGEEYVKMYLKQKYPDKLKSLSVG